MQSSAPAGASGSAPAFQPGSPVGVKLVRGDVDMTATGTVCGTYPDATYVVTHSFTGRYVVDASTSRKLVGSTGFMSQVITVDGRSGVQAIATQ